VNVAVDISPQHHSLIIGQGGVNLQQVMQRTGATVQFPNPSVSDPQHRGTVYISGTLTSVCAARQLLLARNSSLGFMLLVPLWALLL